MLSWLKPRDSDDFTSADGLVHWLCNTNLFLEETELVVTKHGFVDKEVITKVVQPINNYARKTVSADEHILLLVDGHSSGQGEAWLQKCQNCAFWL